MHRSVDEIAACRPINSTNGALVMPPDRSIAALLGEGRTLRSLEFFPPEDEAGIDLLQACATALRPTKPDFVSVTYRAGNTGEQTKRVWDLLRRDFGFTVMPHLTCIGQTEDELLEVIDHIHASGYRNIMTLRGDLRKDKTVIRSASRQLRYASDLVSLIKSRQPAMCLCVGSYPEKHPEEASLESDLANLKRKANAGADFITTQLFFDNDVYFRFVERCRAAGITIPIVPGIMPALSLKQVQYFANLCSVSLPKSLVARLEAAGESTEIAELVGIDWALKQVRDLLAHGVPGYHIHTLNRTKAVLSLVAGLAA